MKNNLKNFELQRSSSVSKATTATTAINKIYNNSINNKTLTLQ